MAKKVKRLFIYMCVICVLLLIVIVPTYKCIRTYKSTKLLSQNINGITFNILYDDMPFCWGIDAPLSKAIDFSPSTNYWISDVNPNIALSVSVSANSKYKFLYKERLLKKANYLLPEVSSENVSKIVLARQSYNRSLQYTDNHCLYWNSIECISIDLTEYEKTKLAELILNNSFDCEADYTEKFPQSGEPYLLFFRFYFKGFDGIFYEPGMHLYRTSDNRYFLSLSRLDNGYVFLPDDINQKFQALFKNNDFGLNIDKV